MCIRDSRNTLRHLDGKNHVVESEVGRSVRRDRAAVRVDGDVIRFDADFMKHGREQRGLVFAVSIAMSEHLACTVRLPASDTQFNRHVANVTLYKLGQGPDLRKPRWVR